MSNSASFIFEEMEKVQASVKTFKERSKAYYFDVLFSKYRCPICTKKPKINSLSQAECICGYLFDPTLQFQRSSCCNARLIRQIYHYVCSQCGKYVKSLFLFDKRIFDKEYFREMMAQSRERKKQKREQFSQILRDQSEELILGDSFDLEELESLSNDLDTFILPIDRIPPELTLEIEEFDMLRYRNHILTLFSDELLFSSITPLAEDSKKDRAWKFITLIFMEHEREVWLTQYGNDILVERYEAHCEG